MITIFIRFCVVVDCCWSLVLLPSSSSSSSLWRCHHRWTCNVCWPRIISITYSVDRSCDHRLLLRSHYLRLLVIHTVPCVSLWYTVYVTTKTVAVHCGHYQLTVTRHAVRCNVRRSRDAGTRLRPLDHILEYHFFKILPGDPRCERPVPGSPSLPNLKESIVRNE